VFSPTDEFSPPNPRVTPDPEIGLGGIPRVLEPSVLEEIQRQFITELAPVGAVESVLVADLARQATAMERWHDAALAMARHGARALPMLTTSVETGEQSILDSILVSAMSTDAADRSERHSLARTRAFHRTLKRLEEVQDRRRERERAGRIVVPTPFANETAFEEYLVARLRCESHRCGDCGSATGSYLPSRQVWECGKCRKQFGLRSGTVLAGSALSLFTWSEAIRLLLWRPTISALELAEMIGVTRIATVRSMMAKIRTAMASENASERLAGLDRHFASNSST
jgi:transposase-like protein